MPSNTSTKARQTLEGLLKHLFVAMLMGGAAGGMLYSFGYSDAPWLDADTANLRQFASTASSIAAGLGGLVFAGVGLLLALPATHALKATKTSGHFFDLSARLSLTVVLWLVASCCGLAIVMFSHPGAIALCVCVALLVAALASTLSSLLKVLWLVHFANRPVDPDYVA